MVKRKGKSITFRIKTEDYGKLQHKAAELDFESVSQLLRSMIKDLISGWVKTEPEKKEIYPDDIYCKRIYGFFLNHTPDNMGGAVSKDLARKIQLESSISMGKTFKIRIEMLKAQGFLVEKGNDYIVMKKWS